MVTVQPLDDPVVARWIGSAVGTSRGEIPH